MDEVKTMDDNKLFRDIKEISPRLYNILQSADTPFTSMELWLPIVLDNYNKFNNNSTINQWLKDNKFLDKNGITDKPIERRDLTNFGGTVAQLLPRGYTLKYSDIFSNYHELLNGTDHSVDKLFSDLRSENRIYSSNIDLSLVMFRNELANTLDDVRIELSENISKLLINDSKYQDALDVILTKSDNKLVQISAENCKNAESFGTIREGIGVIVKQLANATDIDIRNACNYLNNINYDTLVIMFYRIQRAINDLYLSDNKEQVNLDIDNTNKKLLSTLKPALDNLPEMKKLSAYLSADPLRIADVPVMDTPSTIDMDPKVWQSYIKRSKDPSLMSVNPNMWEYLATISGDSVDSIISSAKDFISGLWDDKRSLYKFHSLGENLRKIPVVKNLKNIFLNRFLKLSIDNISNTNDKKFKLPDVAQLNKDAEILKENIEYLTSLYENIYEQYIISNKFSREKQQMNKDSKITKPIGVKQYFAESFNVDTANFINKFFDFIKQEGLPQNLNTVYDFINTLNTNEDIKDNAINNLSSDLIQEFNLDLETKIKPTIDALLKRYEGIKNLNITLAELTDKAAADAERAMDEIEKYYMDLYEKLKSFITNPVEFVEPSEVDMLSEETGGLFAAFFNKLFHRSAAKFNDNDLDVVLKDITTNVAANRTIRSDKYTTETIDSTRLSILAEDIIDFLNLRSLFISSPTDSREQRKFQDTVIKTVVGKLTTLKDNYRNFVKLYPKYIDIDLLSDNIYLLAAMIVQNLIYTSVSLSFDNLITKIKDMNVDISKPLNDFDDKPLNNECCEVLQELNISMFDPQKYNSNKVSTNNMTLYVANKMVEKYIRSLQDILNDNKNKYNPIIDYIRAKRFQLVSQLTSQVFGVNVITSIINNILDTPASVEVMYNNLKYQYRYRFLPDNMVKAIANYETVKNAAMIVRHAFTDDKFLEQVIGTEGFIEFTDESLLPILSKTGLYDFTYNVTTDKNILTGLKETNVLKPNNSKFANVNFDTNPFRSLFNVIALVKKYDLGSNALFITKMLNSVNYNKNSVEKEFNEVKNKMKNFIETSKNVEDVNTMKTYQTEYENLKDSIMKNLDSISVAAKNQATKITDINKFIDNIQDNYPLMNYVDIIEEDYDRLLKTPRHHIKEEDILPVKFQVNVNKIKEEEPKNFDAKAKIDKLGNYSVSLQEAFKVLSMIKNTYRSQMEDMDINNVSEHKEMKNKNKVKKGKIALINALLTKINSQLNTINELSNKLYNKDNVISVELINQEVKKVKNILYEEMLKLGVTQEDSDSKDIFEITETLSKQLLNLEQQIVKISKILGEIII